MTKQLAPAFKPLMLLQDMTVLLETGTPVSVQAAQALAQFAELIKCPPHVHTYRLTPLMIWQAAMNGWTTAQIIDTLASYSKHDVPQRMQKQIAQWWERSGKLILEEIDQANMRLYVYELDWLPLLKKLLAEMMIGENWQSDEAKGWLDICKSERGRVKQRLLQGGYPVEDRVGYANGTPLLLQFNRTDFYERGLRDYQRAAVASFYDPHTHEGGSGLVILPCGSGKTRVGIAAMVAIQKETLIVTSSTVAAEQWKKELMTHTNAGEQSVSIYGGRSKQVRPVTITTYQMLATRRNAQFVHMDLFQQRDWGLIIYDEVHMLPAPVFRATADIQAVRRLGLTATLVREDGREVDVFALIGPTRYQLGWRKLELEGWIAEASCVQIQVPFACKGEKRHADKRSDMREAAENPLKTRVVQALLSKHRGQSFLIIGHYIRQLKLLAEHLGWPLICGDTPEEHRQQLYEQYRAGSLSGLVVSRVANFAVDLPEASVAIQVSGCFGSRQEEAQRLGRVLRPKARAERAYFYTLVSSQTKEAVFALKRQQFLAEQGYAYQIVSAEEVLHEPLAEGGVNRGQRLIP